MKIRISLDEYGIDAELCGRIKGKAGNGSINEAAKFLLRYWFEREKWRDLTPACQDLTPGGQVASSLDDFDLSGLDAVLENLE